MDPRSAELCLRNLVQLVSPGGHLFVTGVHLGCSDEARARARLGPDHRAEAEIHDGDPLVRSDWPWHWWGLEPLDRRRPDWETRYAAAFRISTNPSAHRAPERV